MRRSRPTASSLVGALRAEGTRCERVPRREKANFFRRCSEIEGRARLGRTHVVEEHSSHLAAANDAFFSLARSNFFTRMFD